MTRARSTTILFGFVTFFAGLTFGMWCLVWTPPLPSLDRLLMASLAFGGIFGGLVWSLLTTPSTPTRNDGWRKYRFPMWWAAIILFFEGGILLRGEPFRFWGDFVPVFGIALTLTTIGWALGSMRAARAEQDIKFKNYEDIRPRDLN